MDLKVKKGKLSFKDLVMACVTKRFDAPGRKSAIPPSGMVMRGVLFENPEECKGIRLDGSRRQRRKLGKEHKAMQRQIKIEAKRKLRERGEATIEIPQKAPLPPKSVRRNYLRKLIQGD